MILLTFIPSALVLARSAGGRPATLFAVTLLGWYSACGFIPASALDRGRQPVRAAAIFFACIFVAAYVSANRQRCLPWRRTAPTAGLILLTGWLAYCCWPRTASNGWDRLQVLLRRIVTCISHRRVGITQFATGLISPSYVVIPGFCPRQIAFVDLLAAAASTAIRDHRAPLEFAAVLALPAPGASSGPVRGAGSGFAAGCRCPDRRRRCP